MGPASDGTPANQRQFCHPIEHVVPDDRLQSLQHRRRRVGEVVGGAATDSSEGGQGPDDGRRFVGQHLVLQVAGDQLGGPFRLQKGESGPHGWLVEWDARWRFSHSEESQFRCVEGEIAPAEEASLAGDHEAAEAHVSEASSRHHNVHSGRRVSDEEAEQFGAGVPRQFEPVETQRGGPPAIAGGQRRGQVRHGPANIVETVIAGFTAGRLGQQARETGSELTRAGVSGRAGIADVGCFGAQLRPGLVEDNGASKAGRRHQATEGELVPQPECGEEPVAADQGAHSLSVFRRRMLRVRSTGGLLRESSSHTSSTTGGLRLVNAPP